MAYNKQVVLDISAAEVGYLEKETNTNLDSKTGNAGDENYTKYSRDLAEVSYFNGRKQGVAWCAVFVAWCFFRAFGKAAALKLLCQPTKDNCGAGCDYIVRYFKAKGQWHTSNPKAGDVIVFYNKAKDDYAHTGLVYKVDGSKVYTREGNTSGASGVIDNGGGVCNKSYSLSYDRIAGYGRPDWNMEAVASTEKAETSTAKPDTSSTGTNTSSTSSNTSTGYTTYTVKKGDSLWNIAKKLLGSGSKYTKIQKANGLKGSLIKPGQKLKIPKG